MNRSKFTWPPRARKHRTYQRSLESWLSCCRRVLQHNHPRSGSAQRVAFRPAAAILFSHRAWIVVSAALGQ